MFRICVLFKMNFQNLDVSYYLMHNCELHYSNEMDFFIHQKKLPLKTSAKIHTKGGVRNSRTKADKYFSELTPDQVTQLYEIYKYDFQMYGYEYESYLELSNLDLQKKRIRNSFDLALDQVKKEGKYSQIQNKKKKKSQKDGKNNKFKRKFDKKGGLNYSKPKNVIKHKT